MKTNLIKLKHFQLLFLFFFLLLLFLFSSFFFYSLNCSFSSTSISSSNYSSLSFFSLSLVSYIFKMRKKKKVERNHRISNTTITTNHSAKHLTDRRKKEYAVKNFCVKQFLFEFHFSSYFFSF